VFYSPFFPSHRPFPFAFLSVLLPCSLNLRVQIHHLCFVNSFYVSRLISRSSFSLFDPTNWISTLSTHYWHALQRPRILPFIFFVFFVVPSPGNPPFFCSFLPTRPSLPPLPFFFPPCSPHNGAPLSSFMIPQSPLFFGGCPNFSPFFPPPKR